MRAFQDLPSPLNVARALLARFGWGAAGAFRRLSAGARVVELGCGRGIALLTLAAAFPRSHFLGLDRSADAVAEAIRLAGAHRLDNVIFRRIDDRPTPALETFDLVISGGSVMWR